MIDFYKMSDVFLFPSYREGLPVAVMEAIASGLPVIATKIRGSSDLVQQNTLFAPTDVNGIARAMEKELLGDRTQKADEFNIKKIMGLMREIYGI